MPDEPRPVATSPDSDFTLTIDQPKGFGGANSGPKPSEVLLAALAACQEITWRLYADALGIPLSSIRVELDGVGAGS